MTNVPVCPLILDMCSPQCWSCTLTLSVTSAVYVAVEEQEQIRNSCKLMHSHSQTQTWPPCQISAPETKNCGRQREGTRATYRAAGHSSKQESCFTESKEHLWVLIFLCKQVTEYTLSSDLRATFCELLIDLHKNTTDAQLVDLRNQNATEELCVLDVTKRCCFLKYLQTSC